MAKLLIIDPLDLRLSGDDGQELWSSRECFRRAFEGIDGVDCSYTTAMDPELCDKALDSDGVVLGGSEASAWEDTPFNDHLLDLIAICRNSEIPLLAICYGAQLLGRALGGHVMRHPEGMELGAPPIRINAKGRDHFLFKGIEGGCIWSVETHNDAVMTLPPDCTLLASTAHTPVQAFSFRGLLNGVQFHPEMNADDLRSLWEAFGQAGYVKSVSAEQRRILDACECDAVDQLLFNFAKRVESRFYSAVAL